MVALISDCFISFTKIFVSPDFQEVVSLQCWGINDEMFGDFWKGLEFYNTTLEMRILQTDNTKMNVSTSKLSYVDIQYAGVNSSMHHVGALSASPFPPVLNNVRLFLLTCRILGHRSLFNCFVNTYVLCKNFYSFNLL